MGGFLSMASSFGKGFEEFCLNFTRGLSWNIGLIKKLIDDDDLLKQDPGTSQSTTPSAQTELARRRAELRRRQGGEGSPKKVERKTVRSLLCRLIKINGLLSLLMLCGMTQLIIPLLNFTLGDTLKKNQVLETAVSRLLVFVWLTPIMLLTKITNTFLMNDLSSMAYQETKGHPVQTGVATIISDLLYTIIFQLFYFIEVSASAWIPIRIYHVNVVELVLTSIMYSMYAFEYKWMNMGYGARKRLDMIDKNFSFYFGFGFPLAFAVLIFDNFWIGAALNSLLFSGLILSAYYASEPREIRGWTKPVFLPAYCLLEGFFWVVNKLGFKLTFYSVLLLAVMGVLVWLGVAAALATGLTQLGSSLPLEEWGQQILQLWEEYV